MLWGSSEKSGELNTFKKRANTFKCLGELLSLQKTREEGYMTKKEFGKYSDFSSEFLSVL